MVVSMSFLEVADKVRSLVSTHLRRIQVRAIHLARVIKLLESHCNYLCEVFGF